jgi:Fe-S cluster assembly protein SufD
MHDFEINFDEINNKKISLEEKEFRNKNLKLFNSLGFPNKRLENWKFTDLKEIIYRNFDQLNTKVGAANINKINLLKDFDHNYIFLVNGNLHTSNFDHEKKDKIKINSYENDVNYPTSTNSLVCLNHALAENGYSLEIEKNYKFKKALIIYNFFTKEVKNKILNIKNKIKINENSEIHFVEYTINESKFINNVYEHIVLEKNSKLKSLYIQSNKNEGYFYKFLQNKLHYNSDYLGLIFSSGLKFNKMDIECDLIEKNCKCNILSALFLDKNEHQEIKTRINHLAPNCKSFQNVKKVLCSESKGVYQGKIYVKDKAQKTDAYQQSKALLLNDNAEFDSKPELEIYADDVKCSHGSTSGSVDEDSLYYLMTRGLNRDDAVKLLVKGFLDDVVEFIKSSSIKKFVNSKLEDRINEH